MTGLTDKELDSLTECECGHYANEHSSDGCLATDFSESDDRPVRDDDVCPCTHSPSAITRHAVERIKADAGAAARAEMRAKIGAEVVAAVRCASVHGQVRGGFCVDCLSWAKHVAPGVPADGGEPQ